MPPTEHDILTNYLLTTAQLPSIISLQEFTALFPRALQSSPQIRSLYRDLQSQRNSVVDEVASNIDEEARRGKAMRRAVIRARRDAEKMAREEDGEVEIERMVSTTVIIFRGHACHRIHLSASGISLPVMF
jgi:centromere-localized protein 2